MQVEFICGTDRTDHAVTQCAYRLRIRTCCEDLFGNHTQLMWGYLKLPDWTAELSVVIRVFDDDLQTSLSRAGKHGCSQPRTFWLPVVRFLEHNGGRLVVPFGVIAQRIDIAVRRPITAASATIENASPAVQRGSSGRTQRSGSGNARTGQKT